MPGDPVTVQPFDRTGTKLDLSDRRSGSISGKRSRTTGSTKMIETLNIEDYEQLAA
jgi:hypothetical protein